MVPINLDVLGLSAEDAIFRLETAGMEIIHKKTTPPASRGLSTNFRVIRQKQVSKNVIEVVLAPEIVGKEVRQNAIQDY